MGVITRETVPSPALPVAETVPLPSLGAEVSVRAQRYTVRARIEAETARQLVAMQTGETDDDANARIGAEVVLTRLAGYVTLEDGESMWTREQWDAHMAQHPGEALAVYEVVRRLNGLDREAIAKN